MSAGGITLRPHSGHFDEKNKPEEQSDAKQIFLSPTVKYAGCQSYAPKYEWVLGALLNLYLEGILIILLSFILTSL